MKVFVVTIKTKNGEDCFLYQASSIEECKRGVRVFIKLSDIKDIFEKVN